MDSGILYSATWGICQSCRPDQATVSMSSPSLQHTVEMCSFRNGKKIQIDFSALSDSIYNSRKDPEISPLYQICQLKTTHFLWKNDKLLSYQLQG